MADGVARAGWMTRLHSLRHLPAFLKLVFETHRGYAAAMVTLRCLRALLPVAILWIARLIIDAIIGATRGAPPASLWWYVAAEMFLVTASEILARASALVEALLGDLLADEVSVRLMTHASALDLTTFEDPAVYDRLERARQQAAERVGPLTQVLGLAQDAITLAGLAAVVCSYNFWLAALLLIGVVPTFVGEMYFSLLDYLFTFRNTGPLRALAYLRYLAASDVTAKEVRAFDLCGWLTGRHRTLARRLHRERAALHLRKNGVAVALSSLGVIAYYTAYVLIVRAALRGDLSIGQLTMLAAAFSRTRDLVQRILLSAAETHRRSLGLGDLFAFFEMRPHDSPARGTRPCPAPIRDGFVLENVSFRYPGADRWAIRHVSFQLPAGACIALVGENGAGKTTITRLLAGLYEPTEGRILLDGIDVREYDLTSLRRAVGVMFQDFVRYNMRFDENIGIGLIQEVGEQLDAAAEDTSGAHAPATTSGRVPTGIAAAAERSLASTIVDRLPDGYRQMLGRSFAGGLELSGGEWQKVALARTYMRVCCAQLLILDEPTSALDARAEAQIFERFRTLARLRTAIVISHRLATVRAADRIVVLAQGRVVEDGTHGALLERGGLYAELFGLQAAAYR